MFNEVEPQGAVRIAGQFVGHGGQALDDLSKAQTGGYLWDGPVAVALCSNPEEACPLSGMLLDLRGTQLVEVGIGTGDDIPYDWLENWAQNLSYIILDADAWGGIPALVGFCMWLRRLAPSVPRVVERQIPPSPSRTPPSAPPRAPAAEAPAEPQPAAPPQTRRKRPRGKTGSADPSPSVAAGPVTATLLPPSRRAENLGPTPPRVALEGEAP